MTRLHPLATIERSGADSGCQGCDPAITGTRGADTIRLCSECCASFPLTTPLYRLFEELIARRRSLGLPL